MTNSANPHLDPELLSAFAEGALPPHERQQCLAHLAECPRCREIAFLSSVPETVPAPKKRSWLFGPIPALAGSLAAVSIIILTVLWHHPSQLPQQVAPVRTESTKVEPTPPPPPSPQVATAAARPPVAFAPQQQSLSPPVPVPPVETAGEIKGSVTDATGAAVPNATVTIQPPTGSTTTTAKTDTKGKFIAKMPAGRYSVNVESPGFERAKTEVEVKPQETAQADTALKVGSAAQSVEVLAAAPMPFPGNPIKTVLNGNIVLSLDATGNLRLTKDAGKSWKPVKPKWKGRVTDISVASGAFQITTDSGEVWTSENGTRWKLKK